MTVTELNVDLSERDAPQRACPNCGSDHLFTQVNIGLALRVIVANFSSLARRDHCDSAKVIRSSAWFMPASRGFDMLTIAPNALTFCADCEHQGEYTAFDSR